MSVFSCLANWGVRVSGLYEYQLCQTTKLSHQKLSRTVVTFLYVASKHVPIQCQKALKSSHFSSTPQPQQHSPLSTSSTVVSPAPNHLPPKASSSYPSPRKRHCQDRLHRTYAHSSSAPNNRLPGQESMLLPASPSVLQWQMEHCLIGR